MRRYCGVLCVAEQHAANFWILQLVGISRSISKILEICAFLFGLNSTLKEHHQTILLHPAYTNTQLHDTFTDTRRINVKGQKEIHRFSECNARDHIVWLLLKIADALIVCSNCCCSLLLPLSLLSSLDVA